MRRYRAQSCRVVLLGAFGAIPGAAAAHIWLYADVADGRWCAVNSEAHARAIAADPAFASGLSATITRTAAGRLAVRIQTQSDDARVADLYRFDDRRRIVSLDRRGRYLDGPYIEARYVATASGRLRRVASASRARRASGAGVETYFIDWPRYATWPQMPFSGAVALGKVVTVRLPCPPSAGAG